MFAHDSISRRKFFQSAAMVAGAAATPGFVRSAFAGITVEPLEEFGYRDVTLMSELHERQLRQSHAVLMSLSDDSLLKPLRAMAGLPAPGVELGGWYLYDPNYDFRKEFNEGFAPACTFGQWVSALARIYAITGDAATRERVLRLNRLYAQTISGNFYENNRFPTYCYDKIVCGLIDSHRWVGDPDAFPILERTTDVALPHMPKTAIEHGKVWREGKDESWTWDESYTISENLFLAYQRGAGRRYRDLGGQFLDDEYYGPLSEGHNNLAGRHAYSHVNSLSSAMQAYMTLGSEKHLRAAKNAFDMLSVQSFATGGWGPDEQLRAPGSGEVAASLSNTHNSFETPCGAYAHFKLTRYLLRVTRDSRYGDSMERMMYNTILGAKPLEADGRTFYYADCNFEGKKFYHQSRWPCCSGTYPQVAADYRINTYLRDRDGIYVNLYIPSKVSWVQSGTQVSLTQKSEYPYEDVVRLEVAVSRPAEFAVNLRIPAWADGAEISVSGQRQPQVTPGSFAAIRREWKSGDQIQLYLPMKTRLEPVDETHPEIGALLQGPLVLFAINKGKAAVTRQQLLAAKKTAAKRWTVETSTGPLTMLPFTEIDDQTYSTYLKIG